MICLFILSFKLSMNFDVLCINVLQTTCTNNTFCELCIFFMLGGSFGKYLRILEVWLLGILTQIS